MAYTRNLYDSARRHFQAADDLHQEGQGHRQDVAGYLYGIAAECALKEIMRRSEMKPLGPDRKRDDPFFAHFPLLKTLLRDNAKGRRHGELLKYAKDPKFMQNWETNMRYAPAEDVSDRDVLLWREQASGIVKAMEE